MYPAGFVPYARRQLVGGPVQDDVPSLMDVVEHAAAKGPVGREPTGAAEGSWSTQNRLVDRVAELFALRDEPLRALLASLVGLPLIALEGAARCQGVRERARALLGLCEGLGADVLVGMGALVGLWGAPHRWCGRRDQLVPMGLSP